MGILVRILLIQCLIRLVKPALASDPTAVNPTETLPIVPSCGNPGRTFSGARGGDGFVVPGGAVPLSKANFSS